MKSCFRGWHATLGAELRLEVVHLFVLASFQHHFQTADLSSRFRGHSLQQLEMDCSGSCHFRWVQRETSAGDFKAVSCTAVCLSVCLTLSIPSVLTSLANPVQFRHSITSYCRDLNGDQGSGAQQLRPVEMSCPGTSEALGSVPLGDGDVATMEGTDWPLVIQKPALG